MALETGDLLPNFELETTAGAFCTRDLDGGLTVIYFYPKDNTPGCTLEAQGFRDLAAEFARLGCVIFGVSRDSIKSHQNFQAKQGLPFELISDPGERLCEAFGVMKFKNMYGKQVRGIERSTFLIDQRGYIAVAWRGVKVDGHAATVLASVHSLQSTH